MKNFKDNLGLAKYLDKLVVKAYKICSKNKIKIVDKNTHDLLTTLDTSIEKYMIEKLQKDFPNVKIVSEEFNTTVKAEGTYFVIDPIDGTVNFANNISGLWGVQCAYVENDVLLASAMLLPEKGNYYAGKGCGTYKNGKLLKVAKRDAIHSLVCLEVRQKDINKKLEQNLCDKILKFRYFGASCADLVYMAEGGFGGIIVSDNNPWDILPGILLMEESGSIRKTIGFLNVFASSQDTFNVLVKAVEECLTKGQKHETMKTKAAIYKE